MIRLFIIHLLLTLSLNADNKPNILLISIDDLNDWVGYMKGHPQVQTPHIDKLAKRGVAFLDAHCSSPLCNPSRSSLLTGKHAPETKVFNNSNKFEYQNFVLMPQYFAKHGYRTYGVGKIHHRKINQHIFEKSYNPEQRWSPFQNPKSVLYTTEELTSKGSENPRHVINNGPGGMQYILPFNRMPSDRKPNQKSGESHDWQGFNLKDQDFGDGMAADWAVQQLKEHKNDKPFFMGVGFYRPHIPLYAPQKYFALYPLAQVKLPAHRQNDLDDLSSSGKKWALEAITAGSHSTLIKYNQWRQAIQAYLACVSFIDAQVGKILTYLETSPHAKNTIIILFSDHGWHLGEKQHWGKWTGWDRSTRVPFIISKAGQKQGENCEEPVNIIDIFPTLIDMAGLPALEMDAKSIKNIVDNPALKRNRTVFSYFDQGNFAVINKKWRLIRYSDGSKELYDRINDPHEFDNLSTNSRYQSLIKSLLKEIPAWGH